MTAAPLQPGTAPSIDARINDAGQGLLAHGVPLMCPHYGEAIVMAICAEHPGAGLLCVDRCLPGHARRHADDVEHRCDVCGQQAPTIRSVLGELTGYVRTQTTAGASGYYLGRILVACLGICPPCAAHLGIPETT